MDQNKNEWNNAFVYLNSCIATMKCGCSITPDEGLLADSIYYRCKEYIQVYDDTKYWESRYRKKE